MDKLLKEYLFIFLSLIIFLGVIFTILIVGLTGERESLEKIYLFLFIFMALLLVFLVSGLLLFFVMFLRGSSGFKQKAIPSLDITPAEIAKLSQPERKELLKKLKDKKDEIEAIIKITKKKFYQRELDQESFMELIKEHEKNLIELESKIEKIKKIRG